MDEIGTPGFEVFPTIAVSSRSFHRIDQSSAPCVIDRVDFVRIRIDP